MNNKIDINGLTNKVDVINSIIDNIDDGNLDIAKDSLNQLKQVEVDNIVKDVLIKDHEEALNPLGKYILKDPLDSEIAKQLELPMLELENEMTVGK